MRHEINRASSVSPIDAGNAITAQQPLQVWGGAEYTCNRVGNRYFDQMDLSGHARRLSDFEAIAALGIKTLRLGLLWERHSRDPSWGWFDERLRWMQEAGMRPIAGLLHHGSGPPHTSLLDPEFPQKLAAYAGEVAERYPWIDAYTPVNEPHTTARFSAMYGIWYPHHRSRASCLRALLYQMKGTVLSMQAIRRVRPDAQLIQTDDLGRVSGTAKLQYVWTRLDLRRWLPFDLLCGRVDRRHPMFAEMVAEGISEKEILWFADHPCAPDIIGVNYYLTSDRYLDHRVHLYPPGLGSSEGNFVDVETVRVLPEGITGFDSLLLETWQRYRIPVAVTEVHLGGHVNEQMRWVAEAWEGIMRARRLGVECSTLTVWALLGSFYWNKLVTCENGHYEPGVFDVRGGKPVATELAKVVAQIANGHPPLHPALASDGWWRNEQRICFPLAESDAEIAA
jgi:dTDP-4-dehydrorhamnose reductase